MERACQGCREPAIQEGGRLIQAGTGYQVYRNVRIPADEPPQPSPEELDMEFFVELEQAFTRNEIE